MKSGRAVPSYGMIRTKHSAEAEDVGPAVHNPAAHLFGRHVSGSCPRPFRLQVAGSTAVIVAISANPGLSAGSFLAMTGFGQAKVENLDAAFLGLQRCCQRLKITMCDALGRAQAARPWADLHRVLARARRFDKAPRTGRCRRLSPSSNSETRKGAPSY